MTFTVRAKQLLSYGLEIMTIQDVEQVVLELGGRLKGFGSVGIRGTYPREHAYMITRQKGSEIRVWAWRAFHAVQTNILRLV